MCREGSLLSGSHLAVNSRSLMVDALLNFTGQDGDVNEFRCTLKHQAGGQIYLDGSTVLVLEEKKLVFGSVSWGYGGRMNCNI